MRLSDLATLYPSDSSPESTPPVSVVTSGGRQWSFDSLDTPPRRKVSAKNAATGLAPFFVSTPAPRLGSQEPVLPAGYKVPVTEADTTPEANMGTFSHLAITSDDSDSDTFKGFGTKPKKPRQPTPPYLHLDTPSPERSYMQVLTGLTPTPTPSEPSDDSDAIVPVKVKKPKQRIPDSETPPPPPPARRRTYLEVLIEYTPKKTSRKQRKVLVSPTPSLDFGVMDGYLQEESPPYSPSAADRGILALPSPTGSFMEPGIDTSHLQMIKEEDASSINLSPKDAFLPLSPQGWDVNVPGDQERSMSALLEKELQAFEQELQVAQTQHSEAQTASLPQGTPALETLALDFQEEEAPMFAGVFGGLQDSESTTSPTKKHSTRDYTPDSDAPLENFAPDDVDTYLVTVYPADLLNTHDPGTALQLVSQVPQPKPRDVSYFSDWIFAARAMAHFRIAPEFKIPLITHLVEEYGYTLEPNTYDIALTRGNQALLMGTFVKALVHIGCEAVRICIYGIKHPLHVFPFEPANRLHPLRKYNCFDLGRVVTGTHLTLFRRAFDTHQAIKEAPMFLEAGQNFGSISMSLRYQKLLVDMKMYANCVHNFKSIAISHMDNLPKTYSALRDRFKTIKKLLIFLLKTHLKGGYRMEVTINAETLGDAVKLVSDTPLLNIKAYLVKGGHPLLSNYQVATFDLHPTIAVTHAKDVVSKAQHGNFFRGKGVKTLPKNAFAIRVLRDSMNSTGWNPRAYKPTRWNDPEAWWRDIELPRDGVPIRREAPPSGDDSSEIDVEEPPTHSNPPSPKTRGPNKPKTAHYRANSIQHLESVEDLTSFFLAIRTQYPCMHCHAKDTNNRDGGTKQFKLRCKACKKRTMKQKAKDYFDLLLTAGAIDVDLTQFRGTTEPAAVQEEEASPGLGDTTQDAPSSAEQETEDTGGDQLPASGAHARATAQAARRELDNELLDLARQSSTPPVPRRRQARQPSTVPNPNLHTPIRKSKRLLEDSEGEESDTSPKSPKRQSQGAHQS